jgi:hypothetical protein
MPDQSKPVPANPIPTAAAGDWTFLLKVLGLSGLIAVAIKGVGPMLPIGPTHLNATLAIVTPSVLLGVIFLFRLVKSSSQP